MREILQFWIVCAQHPPSDNEKMFTFNIKEGRLLIARQSSIRISALFSFSVQISFLDFISELIK